MNIYWQVALKIRVCSSTTEGRAWARHLSGGEWAGFILSQWFQGQEGRYIYTDRQTDRQMDVSSRNSYISYDTLGTKLPCSRVCKTAMKKPICSSSLLNIPIKLHILFNGKSLQIIAPSPWLKRYIRGYLWTFHVVHSSPVLRHTHLNTLKHISSDLGFSLLQIPQHIQKSCCLCLTFKNTRTKVIQRETLPKIKALLSPIK